MRWWTESTGDSQKAGARNELRAVCNTASLRGPAHDYGDDEIDALLVDRGLVG